MMMKGKTIEEYNMIRVLATILVVIGHAGYVSPQTEYGGIKMFEYTVPIIQKIIDLGIRVIYSFYMPLFFTLSGALFYISINNGRIHSFGNLLLNKGKRLLIPFIICSLFWNIPIKYISGYWSESHFLIKDVVIGQLLLCGNTHLWFLWVLFVVTILSYLLRKHDRIRMLVAFIMFFASGYVNFTFMGIKNILTYFLWFEWGIVIEKNREALMQLLLRKSVFWIISSIFWYGIGLILYLFFAKGNEYIYGIINLLGIICSFVISVHLCESNIIKYNWYDIILKYSFYIYLLADAINYPILTIIKEMDLKFILESNIGAGVLFLFRIIFPICFAIVFGGIISQMSRLVRSKLI